jgi:phage shock protein PspC (stress-responsive transcriptional regulator)
MSTIPPLPPLPQNSPGNAGAVERGSTSSEVKQCPYCLEEIKADAVRCRHCKSWLHGNPLQHEWHRSENGRIAGVCQGLAEQFKVSPTLLRLLFVLSTLFGAGIGLVAYVALWVIMPVQVSKF